MVPISCDELKVGELAEIMGPENNLYIGTVITKLGDDTIVSLQGREPFVTTWIGMPHFELRVLRPDESVTISNS